MLFFILFAFVLYFFLSISFFENLRGKYRTRFLVISCAVVAIVIGSRDPMNWSDSGVYYQEFVEYVKPLGETSSYDRPRNYGEMGFFYLGVISKTLSNSSTFYFIFISAITMLFLYLGIKKYSIFPFIALYVYLGRFVNRNTIQIRAAIAIAIVIWGTVYVTKRKLWKYLLVVFIASRFHTSAYIAFPLYFMNFVKIKRSYIYWGIFASLIIAGFFGETIRDVVSQSDIANEWARSYIEEGSEKAYSNDLTNPVIWYQIFILFIWTFFEERLSKLTEHYYTIRDAYFYSTVILIILCQYAILAGRISTIFATYEMIIVPLLIVLFPKNNRILAHIGVAAFYAAFMYLNIKKYM